MSDVRRCEPQRLLETATPVTVWTWILVAAGGFSVLSLLTGLALAAILNNSGRQLSELIELEAWSSLPVAETSAARNEIAAERIEHSRAGSSSLV
jgi:hypothetical protein